MFDLEQLDVEISSSTLDDDDVNDVFTMCFCKSINLSLKQSTDDSSSSYLTLKELVLT